MADIKLYNSLSRQKEVFRPIDPNHVRIYACGPTVYSYAHIGNARMAVVFDLLARLLKQHYPKVTYASNITDIDDRIMAASKESGDPIEKITRHFEAIYNQDMAALGAPPPDVQPRATETIPEMITLCEALIARGHAYAAEGHVLFSVPSFPAYGTLSGRNRDDQIAVARIDTAPYKKDDADFVLWKPSSDDQPGWDSPWGRGRPGWHIECSAMAEKHLKLPFDIHGGGADLKFPHHENEIAQSCCAHGNAHDLSAFAKVWVHNGFLTVNGEKMSKSLGNFTLTHDLLDRGISGEVIRFVLLSAHYRQPLDWSDEGVEQAQKNLERLYKILHDLKDVPHDDSVAVPEELLDVLRDDLNTPKAYAALNALSKAAAEKKSPQAKSAFKKACDLMGFLQQDPAMFLGYASNDDTSWIDTLLQQRIDAKKAKDFAKADDIRKQLSEKGILIEDTPTGSVWKKKALEL